MGNLHLNFIDVKSPWRTDALNLYLNLSVVLSKLKLFSVLFSDCLGIFQSEYDMHVACFLTSFFGMR